MPHETSARRLRKLVHEMRGARVRSSHRWIERMEAPGDRGPRRPL